MLLRDHLYNKGRLNLMNRALDAYALRQQTAAKNIANATSPTYRPQRVKFEEEFDEAVALHRGVRTDTQHLPVGGTQQDDVTGKNVPAPVPRPEILFSGESHVNVDKEMSALAQNQIRFRFASRMTARYFQGLQTSIRGSL